MRQFRRREDVLAGGRHTERVVDELRHSFTHWNQIGLEAEARRLTALKVLTTAMERVTDVTAADVIKAVNEVLAATVNALGAYDTAPQQMDAQTKVQHMERAIEGAYERVSKGVAAQIKGLLTVPKAFTNREGNATNGAVRGRKGGSSGGGNAEELLRLQLQLLQQGGQAQQTQTPLAQLQLQQQLAQQQQQQQQQQQFPALQLLQQQYNPLQGQQQQRTAAAQQNNYGLPMTGGMGGGGGGPRGVCFVCHQPGHQMKDCPAAAALRNASGAQVRTDWIPAAEQMPALERKTQEAWEEGRLRALLFCRGSSSSSSSSSPFSSAASWCSLLESSSSGIVSMAAAAAAGGGRAAVDADAETKDSNADSNADPDAGSNAGSSADSSSSSSDQSDSARCWVFSVKMRWLSSRSCLSWRRLRAASVSCRTSSTNDERPSLLWNSTGSQCIPSMTWHSTTIFGGGACRCPFGRGIPGGCQRVIG
jgi:hypothetical protein